MKSYFLSKRVVDVLFSLFLLLLASPLFVITAIFIKIYSPKGPVFYGHWRLGKGGKPFKCWKFRTMVPNADQILKDYLAADDLMREEYQHFFKLKKDPRIIKVIGSFLRNSSFDEFPQFFNVLIGQMSIVGPRPIVTEEIEKYGGYFNQLVSIKPGITGLWQTSGRNDVSYDTRVSLDMYYIDHLSFRQDIIIGLKTVKVIFLRKGY